MHVRGETRAARPEPTPYLIRGRGTRRCTFNPPGEVLLAAPDQVGAGEPVAGVRVADGVEEDVGLAAEDGRVTKSPSFFHSTICRSRLTTVTLSGMATRAAMSKAPARRIMRRPCRTWG